MIKNKKIFNSVCNKIKQNNFNSIKFYTTTNNMDIKSIEVNTSNKYDVKKVELSTSEKIYDKVLSLITLPLFMFGIQSIQHNCCSVISKFGKYEQIKYEGLRMTDFPFSRSSCTIFLGMKSLKLPISKVVDKIGNPIILSANINYKITKPERLVFNIQNDAVQYLQNQAEVTLKQIASKYPYDSVNSNDNINLNLKNESKQISDEMKLELQKECDIIGVEIVSFNLTDINYAPEIAQMMLVKQQAEVYMGAKDLIVNSAVDIASNTIKRLDEKGIDMSQDSIQSLVNGLILTISTGNNVQPVISVDNKIN